MRPLEIPVDEYTSPSPHVVAPRTPVAEVRDLMAVEGIRHIPVVDGSHAVGILSDRDLKLLASVPGSDELTAGDVMVKHPYTVESGTSLEAVVFGMSKQKIGSAIVTDKDQVIGIFTSTDALNALVEILRGDLP